MYEVHYSLHKMGGLIREISFTRREDFIKKYVCNYMWARWVAKQLHSFSAAVDFQVFSNHDATKKVYVL
jgi:hypothetical protein